MTPEEQDSIKQINRAIEELLQGKIPAPLTGGIAVSKDLAELDDRLNTLIQHFCEIRESLIPLSQGDLDITIPRHNLLASPFKQLQASLRHLTWQTQEIARGDYNQRVDFMGDFSLAFNSMVDSLKEARTQLLAEVGQFRGLAEIKSRYLNVMAHDIRTPIGAILGFIDIILASESLDGENLKYARIIKRSADSLLSLINNILDLAKLEKHKVELNSETYSIRTLARDIGELLQPKLQDGVRFHLDLAENLPDQLIGDAHRLEQILINLVGNAAKFTETGEIGLTVTMADQTEESIRLCFTVSDTGVGIPAEKLSRIFTPFAQADSGMAARFGGTGLGLAIAKELVELMAGSLEVQSSVGYGTTFSFSIADQKMKELPAAPPAEEQAGPISGARILVVDDSPADLKIMAHHLANQGVSMTTCQDSRRAENLLLEALEEGDPFTLALIDQEMPYLNGLQLAARIRSHPPLANLQLAACTAHLEKVDEGEFTRYFSFFITKPVNTATIRHIIDQSRANVNVEEDKAPLAGLKILVVDDSAINRLLVRTILETNGALVNEAENGRSALQETSKTTYHALLMDHLMPQMTGDQAIRQIRARTDHPQPLILAFTASDAEKDIRKLLDAGADGIVAKPVNTEAMLNQLRRAKTNK